MTIYKIFTPSLSFLLLLLLFSLLPLVSTVNEGKQINQEDYVLNSSTPFFHHNNNDNDNDHIDDNNNTNVNLMEIPSFTTTINMVQLSYSAYKFPKNREREREDTGIMVASPTTTITAIDSIMMNSSSSRSSILQYHNRKLPQSHHFQQHLPLQSPSTPYSYNYYHPLENKKESKHKRRHYDESNCTDILPNNFPSHKYHCIMYERDVKQDTGVLVVVSKNEVNDNDNGSMHLVVVYTGTDDWRNVLTDANGKKKPFGPKKIPNFNTSIIGIDNHKFSEDSDDNIRNDDIDDYPWSPPGVKVHAGFDNSVFNDGLFYRVYHAVSSTLSDYNKDQTVDKNNTINTIYVTGHSLGGADSVLAAMALRRLLPTQFDIGSITFGCPKVGNQKWKDYVNSIIVNGYKIDNSNGSKYSRAGKLGVWRFVNGWDIVPRLPGMTYRHVGHTIQLSSSKKKKKKKIKSNSRAKMYYLHNGDKRLGYRPVPKDWSSYPFTFPPRAVSAHFIKHYVQYFKDKSSNETNAYYVNDFERYNGGGERKVTIIVLLGLLMITMMQWTMKTMRRKH